MSSRMIRRAAFAAFTASALSAAGCMQTRILDRATETPIGPSGGVATSPDGRLNLSFGSGDLTSQSIIRIEEEGDLMGWGRLSPTYRIDGKGAVLHGTVGLTVTWYGEVDLTTEHVFLADVTRGAPIAVADAELDVQHSRFHKEIDHFAAFAIVRRSASCDGHECGDSCGEGLVCDAEGACIGEVPGPSCGGVDPDGGTDPDTGPVAHTDGGPFGNEGTCSADGGFPFQHSRVVPCGIFETEPNDTPATAQAAVNGVDQGVDITAEFDGGDDMYLIHIPSGTSGSLLAETFTEIDNYSSCSTELDLSLTLIDEWGREIITKSNGNCPYINYYDNEGDGLWPGDFYIRVHGPAPSSGSPALYHIAIYVLSPLNAPYTADGGINPRDSGM